MTKYTELWDVIKSSIEKINNKSGEYGKDFMKIKFNSNDSLPLNKTLKLHNMTIIVKSVSEKDGKCYPQVILDECLYELQKCCNTIELIFQKELPLIKQVHQKSVIFAIIVILNMLVINFSFMFVLVVMVY